MPPSTCTCTLTAYTPEGAAASGVDFTVRLIDGPGTDGYAISKAAVTATTNGSGVATFTLIRQARYLIWRESDKANARPFDVPNAATFDIPEVLGS